MSLWEIVEKEAIKVGASRHLMAFLLSYIGHVFGQVLN